MEGQAQQTTLVVDEDALRDVQEWRGVDTTVGVDAPDAPALLHDIAIAAAVPGGRQEERVTEAAGEHLQADGERRGRAGVQGQDTAEPRQEGQERRQHEGDHDSKRATVRP